MSYDDDREDESAFGGLHWLTAGLFVAAGAEAAFGRRRGDYRPEDAVRWAPLIAAPIAGAAHIAQALWPGSTTRAVTQVVNIVAIGVGAAGLANSVYAAVTDEPVEDLNHSWVKNVPSLAPLAFAAIGILGFVLQDQEEEVEAERAELLRRSRRISMTERLLPRRRTRVDRIVVHI